MAKMIRNLKTHRRGFTLVELLVVIMIMLMVAVSTLPMILPALDSRRLREASRMITAYLQGARDTAMRNGRPVGVMFERYIDRESGSLLQQFSIVLRQVEIPPPYCGDSLTSTMTVQASGSIVNVTNFPQGDIGWTNLVRLGDIVQLNNQGTLYQITGGQYNTSGTYINYLSASPTTTNPWVLTPIAPGSIPSSFYLSTGVSVPFKIIRQPSTAGTTLKSANPPLQLPESLVIDLQFSGVDSNTNPLAQDFIWAGANDFGPIVMFSPSGAIDRVYYAATYAIPTSTVHFLLGKREQVADGTAYIAANNTTASPAGTNLADLDNLWISIHPQTGLVTSTPLGDINTPGYGSWIAASRQFASTGQVAGGR